MKSAGQDSKNQVQVMRALTAKLTAADAKLHALAFNLPDTAVTEAAAADQRAEAGIAPRPLEGLAVAIKDIIDVAGTPTRAGSLTRTDSPVAKADAHVVSRLRAAGALIPAKTNTVEYAFGGWGTNITVGTPWNPWDGNTHRTPGGSSSGSGVAVGAGLLSAALGTDTGGSVRLPAAFCGCVGLKTSIGLVGRTGVVPLAESFDTIGPMAADVTTAARMLAVMQGEDPDDDTTFGIRRSDPLDGLDAGVRGLRLARLDDQDMPLATPDMRKAFEVALRRLADAGAIIEPFRLPAPFDSITQHCGLMIAVEAYRHNRRFVDDATSLLHANIRGRMAPGGRVLAADWLQMCADWKAAGARFVNSMDRFDALLLPTTPFTAQPVATADEALSPGVHTRFVNYFELCGLSVPMSVTADGLPTGLQIVCRRFDDPLALRIGFAFEQARGAFPKPAVWW